MKISRIETIRAAEFPGLPWLEIHTDDGLTDPGEPFFDAVVAETYIHYVAAPRLIGGHPFAIATIVRSPTGYLGRQAQAPNCAADR